MIRLSRADIGAKTTSLSVYLTFSATWCAISMSRSSRRSRYPSVLTKTRLFTSEALLTIQLSKRSIASRGLSVLPDEQCGAVGDDIKMCASVNKV